MFNFIYPKLEAFGLDISDRSFKIASIEINRKRKQMDLVSYGVFPFERGFIESGRIISKDKVGLIIRDGLSKIHGKRIATKAAVVSLPEEQCFVRVIQLPPMPEKELSEAVAAETEGNIPMSLDEVYYDWQVITRPDGVASSASGENIKHFDVLVAATPKEVVEEYESLLAGIGLLPLIFEPESFAIARAALRNRISYSPLLLVDLGETHTTLAIVSGTSIRVTVSVSVAGGNFTDLISSAFKISSEEAEKKKREHGLGQEGEGLKIFKILEAPLIDLVHQIKGYLAFYASHSFHEHQVWTLAVKTPEIKTMGSFDFRPVSRGEVVIGRDADGKENQATRLGMSGISRIFLTGGGANLAGLPEYLSASLKISVQRANPLINITHIVNDKEGVAPFDPMTYATAIGLAMHRP